MATTRSQVRDLVLTRLQAAAATVGNPLNGFAVESSRVDRLSDDDDTAASAPASTLLVYATAKNDTPQGNYGMAYVTSRTVTVAVAGFVSAATSAALETAMDDLDDALTATLLADQTFLDALAAHPTADWQYTINADGARFNGMVGLSLSCRVNVEVL